MEKEINTEKPRTTKRSILIVEDNEINRELLKGILEENYRVIEAVDGADGMEKLREDFRTLSLIMLDVQMPRMNGYEFLEEYRQDELLSSVPVIVTTGASISEDEERCLSLGASDFVTKPYNPRVILRRVEAIIRLRESIATLQAIEYDTVTGLYTKNAFHHHAQNYLNYSIDESFDMLMVNIESFAYMNERYGETLCNELLKHIGKCIAASENKVLAASRYHADRFIVLRKHMELDNNKEAKKFDTQLHAAAPIADFTMKYAVYENVPTVMPIGVLCDRLAIAMNTIRRQYNKSIAFYDAAMSERITRLRKIEDCMEDALREGQFQVYYQPKHDAKTEQVMGAEALVRWMHPEFGLLPPGDFIPLFEENGFITQLDLYVWQTVCNDLRNWHEEGIPLVPVSVNASRRDFVSIDEIDKVLRPVMESGINREYLHIEITESLGIGDDVVVQKVKSIRDLGIKIELDDFGAGQSSLSTIRDIPMDIIKLDLSFTREIEKQKEIVRMIIALSHALGHETVAEGIETREQAYMLRDLGCDLLQGYYFSKPIPEQAFRAYLKNIAGE